MTLRFFLILGAVFFLGFGFLALPVPKESRNDYGEALDSVARIMWPLGLLILIISGLSWLYNSVVT